MTEHGTLIFNGELTDQLKDTIVLLPESKSLVVKNSIRIEKISYFTL